MADESLDVEYYDGGDADAIIGGGGGYVDDDLDLDDDDDDEPIMGAARSKSNISVAPSAPAPAPAPKRKAKSDIRKESAPIKRKKVDGKDPRDFLLRAAGTREERDYVVTRFVTRMPDLTDTPELRLYRNTEGTEDGRKAGIEADRKQQLYYKSFSGQRRLQRYKKQGLVTIPDRSRKGWTMEVTPRDIVDKKAQLQKVRGVTKANGSASGATPDAAENDPVSALDALTDVFSGTFDGKSSSRYAFMVLNQNDKTVDVVPVDDYCWFSFRANRSQALVGTSVVDAEARMAKKVKMGENRLSKFHVKYEEAQGAVEQSRGDNTRVQQNKEFAAFGIRRSRKAKAENEEEDEAREDLDFDQEFDNDDVAQVDKESVEKRENRVLGDAEKNAKDFQKLIKDEPITSRPGSPGSDSEEDGGQERASNGRSRSPSPSGIASKSRSPSRSANTSAPSSSRQVTPSVMSPSPTRSPRGNTPQKLDLSHLLPAAGTLPTVQHVTAVLSVLLQNKKRIAFKEALLYFERKTKEQKQNLIGVLKKVALVTADPPNSKNYFISWKKSAAPTGK